MDVRLDEPGDDQAAVEIVAGAHRPRDAARSRRCGRRGSRYPQARPGRPARCARRRTRSSGIGSIAPPRRGRDRRPPAPDRSRAPRRLRRARCAGFQHIAAIGDGERQRRHLIDQQDRDALVAQLGENVEQLVDHRRRKPERRLVEQQDARLRHQPARDREHLLLAAGEQSGAAVQPVAQARKSVEQAAIIGSISAPGREWAPSTQIVVDRQFGKHLPAFRHQREACGRDLMGLEPRDAAVVEQDLAVDRAQQAGQRPHDGGLAGAVGADHGDRLAGPHLERDVVQHRRRAIAGGELERRQHRIARTLPGRRARSRGDLAAEIGLDHRRIVADVGRRAVRRCRPRRRAPRHGRRCP